MLKVEQNLSIGYSRLINLTLKEKLDKFLTEYIKYLQRGKKRVERFFKENGINGENLETNLGELEKNIEERNELKKSIDKYKITQQIVIELITNINRKKNEYKERFELFQQQITRLSDQNQHYQQEITRLKFMRNWSRITITDQNIRIRSLQDQIERFNLLGGGNSRLIRRERMPRRQQEIINKLCNENKLLSQVVAEEMIEGAIRIRTIPMFRRQEAFFLKDDDMELDTN
ncbi:hypothetical protein F8M41_001167 [Gigaspora margarita]|uniref:Uncharacterized protein n=1 Tax=Gigaspora margarita TaxID=4874 RepID=A0A8H3XFI4_GIGMA|nr:hypothetical protein F8M41_001167 [Gigaspora margarita]